MFYLFYRQYLISGSSLKKAHSLQRDITVASMNTHINIYA